MKRPIVLACVFLITLLSFAAVAQEGTSSVPGSTGATGFYQSQVYSGANGSYYVDPSRFYYNRPAVTPGTSYTGPQGRTYNIVPGNPYYYGYYYGYYPYPYWNGRIPYRYGPYVYYPRVYTVAPGVTEHLGPFIPLR